MRILMLFLAAMWLALGGCDSSGILNVGGDDDDGNPVDEDGDGFDTDSDCDDTDDAVHPDADEIPYDGVDNDCQDGDLTDVDGDGFDGGDDGEDCDDEDPEMHPGAEELCDGLDNDCSGAPLDGEVDADGDGYMFCGGDCDDDDPQVNPSVPDYPENGVDEDCTDGDAPGLGHACAGDDNLVVLPGSVSFSLSSWSDAEEDGHIYDDIEFSALAGWTVYATMSADFVPAMWLLGPDCDFDNLVAEVDGGGTTTAILEIEIPEDGIYTLIATTSDPDESGDYSIQFESGAVSPGLGTICENDEHATSVGMHEDVFSEYAFELGGSDAMEGPGGTDRYYDDFEFVVRAGDEIDVLMLSDEVDSYIYLLDDACDVIAEDDDSFGGSDARLVHVAPADGIYTAVMTSANPMETGGFDWLIGWP